MFSGGGLNGIQMLKALKKIEEKLLAKNMDVSGLEEKLKDMKNVMKHKKGDYIEMSGLKEENPDMMLPAE